MVRQSLFSFFTDSVLRAPTLGCMLMCLAASLIGVVVFLRKQSLIGEALSHASYPGVIAGILVAGIFSVKESQELSLSLLALVGAFCTSLLGLFAIHALEKKMKVPSDAALCFILSTFFGVGLTIASEVQFSFTSLYKQTVNYLYGQAATMTDIHIAIYGILSLAVIIMIVCLYKELQVMTFDRKYAKSLGIHVKTIDFLLFLLVSLSIIIGIRSVGVVLMSAMLIAPAVAARQLTNRLPRLLILSAIFGVLSGFLGNVFSVEFTDRLVQSYPNARIVLPTGPMIVLVATIICILSLLFAPERGMVIRLWRVARFRQTCLCENLLKEMWRNDPSKSMSIEEMGRHQTIHRWYLHFLLYQMLHHRWIVQEKRGHYRLTEDGRYRAAKIVRLHRLWEVYLVHCLGMGREKVHRNAEEMEHILTPELERELTLLLEDPKEDPHHQPIPSRGA